ncbi:MAG TPA: T9SS type A sorting domain-containing protein [Flavobacterium sp.]|nr:T9SS type A sorting domain-containing protein [Flavobacterium sp.]
MKKYTLLVLLLFGSLTSSFCQTSLCENAVSVSLPFSTTDDTANYGDNYVGSPGSSGCGTPSNYLNGNDVVYAYTATFDGSINVLLSTNAIYVGLFAYANCADIGQNCLAGIVNDAMGGPLSIEAFPVVNGMTYYFVISTWALPQTAAYSLNILENTCINATATYTVVSECSVTEQFFVAVAIGSLGSAFSLTVSDDQGSDTQSVSDPGVVTFGPYPNATPVIFTVANDQDPNCFLTSAPQTQFICAPVNNFCDHAIDLSLETSPLNGTTIGATNQNNPSCTNNGTSGDVYYSILVPNGNTLTIGQTDNDFDSMVTAFFGDCNNQIELTCFDDDDLTVYTYTNNTGTSQTFYWVQDGFNGDAGNFTLAWQLSDCITPDAIYTIVPDCINGEQFLISADIFSLGSATSVTISDDQGSAAQTVTATGQVQFGPYANMTPVIFTITNDEDANCFLTSPAVTQEVCPPTCTNATVTYDIVFDCANFEGYFINVNITDLGSATSVTVSDDQASDSQNATAPGVYQFGPYPNYTLITFTVANDQDSDCVLTDSVQLTTICPPANNDCANAIALIPGVDLPLGALTTSNEGATVSPELPIPSCGNFHFSDFAKDVWYTVNVPASGNITIETAGSGGTGFSIVTDSVIQIYSGNCAGLTPIECDDNDGTDAFSLVSLSGRTPGEVLYIRAFGANGTQGSFVISAYDASLANAVFDTISFTSFPNPVKDILNLSATGNITNVTVFNILGQEVYTKSINAPKSQIDLSNLSKGTYLVKVTTDNQMKTIKVIKE